MLTGALSPSGAPAGGRKQLPKGGGGGGGAGVLQRLEVEDVVVGGGRRPHGIFQFEDDRGRRPGFGPPPERVDQAALDSIWCTLDCDAPLMAIRRGFMASGISRTSSIFSRPLSKDASLT